MKHIFCLLLLIGSAFAQAGGPTVLSYSGPVGVRPSAPFFSIVLADSNGALWSVTLSDNGILQSTPVTSGTTGVYILNWVGNSTSWQLGITTNGNVTETSVSFSSLYPSIFQFLTAPSSDPAQLWVTSNGTLEDLLLP